MRARTPTAAGDAPAVAAGGGEEEAVTAGAALAPEPMAVRPASGGGPAHMAHRRYRDGFRQRRRKIQRPAPAAVPRGADAERAALEREPDRLGLDLRGNGITEADVDDVAAVVAGERVDGAHDIGRLQGDAGVEE